MAHLISFFTGSTADVGFLLPIFSQFPRGNQHLIQAIGRDGRIDSFVNIDCISETSELYDLEVEVGSEAIWGFKDKTGAIYFGTYEEIKSIAPKILSHTCTGEMPMEALELARFCNLTEWAAKLLPVAQEYISKQSRTASAVWRDTAVLTPTLRKELAAGKVLSYREINSVICVSSGRNVDVFLPREVPIHLSTLLEFSVMIRALGLDTIRTRLIRRPAVEVEAPSTAWTAVGIGGVARFVLSRPPFDKLPNQRYQNGWDGVIKSSRGLVENMVAGSLVVSVFGSDLADVERLGFLLRDKFTKFAVFHAINIRPIGYGSPSSKKCSARTVGVTLPELRVTWAVTSHRLLQTGGHTNGLSASNDASRVAQAALSGIIDLFLEGRISEIEPYGNGTVGIVGSKRYIKGLDLSANLKNLLSSMLSDELRLHTASRIVVTIPTRYAKQESLSIKLGRHQYRVNLIPRSKTSRLPTLTGFAIDVDSATRSVADLVDLCAGLLDSLGWVEVASFDDCVVFGRGPEEIRLWPAVSSLAVRNIISRRSERGRTDDIVVVNRTVASEWRKLGEYNNWSVLHFSEIDRFLHSRKRAHLGSISIR